PEVRRAEAAFEGLEAVVAGQASTLADADLAEGDVDLVVEDDDLVEVGLEGAAGGAGRVADRVHVGHRQEDRDAGAAGAGPPFPELALVFGARLAEVPAARPLTRHVEADVVAVARVLGPGVTQADDEDGAFAVRHATAQRPRQAQGALLALGGVARVAVAGVVAAG